MCMALPTHVGAESMAVLLGRLLSIMFSPIITNQLALVVHTLTREPLLDSKLNLRNTEKLYLDYLDT